MMLESADVESADSTSSETESPAKVADSMIPTGILHSVKCVVCFIWWNVQRLSRKSSL